MSDQYIVSARKYRPQTFDTVVGQEHITTTLKNAIRNQHLAHAYLFTGPRGVGKTTCARILAKTINCENPTSDTEACGICQSCKSFSNNASFNIFELDAASNNGVDDIRELVNQVRFAPQQGKYKVYIIDEVHMLSAAAFNAFLKTLEEPPSYAIFILATTEKHKILPTILSRCQIFDFKRITTSDTVLHLQSIASREGMIAQESALHVLAQKSEGCMRDALSMLDRIASFTNGQVTYSLTMEHLSMLDAEFYFGLTDHLLSQDISGTLLELDGVLNKGFEGAVILEGLAEHLRNMLLCKDERMVRLLDVPTEHKNLYLEKARQVPPSFIISGLHQLNDAEINYRNATNKRLHVEMCLIRLCYILQATGAEGIEKKNLDPVVARQPVPAPPLAPTVTNRISESTPEPAAVMPVAELPTQIPAQPVAAAAPASVPAAPLAKEPVVAAQNPANAELPPAPKPIPAPASTSRRISKNLMGDIDDAMQSVSSQQNMPLKELTDTEVQDVFSQYSDSLKAANKSTLHAQFCQMRVVWTPPDEVRIIAPNTLCEEYAKAQRDELIEFFRKQTGAMVRVVAETDHAAESKEVKTTVLSKPEVYEMMATINPNLAKLKDALGLMIDY
jgi:DNA polymerase-3 subunit gamma/tau